MNNVLLIYERKESKLNLNFGGARYFTEMINNYLFLDNYLFLYIYYFFQKIHNFSKKRIFGSFWQNKI